MQCINRLPDVIIIVCTLSFWGKETHTCNELKRTFYNIQSHSTVSFTKITRVHTTRSNQTEQEVIVKLRPQDFFQGQIICQYIVNTFTCVTTAAGNRQTNGRSLAGRCRRLAGGMVVSEGRGRKRRGFCTSENYISLPRWDTIYFSVLYVTVYLFYFKGSQRFFMPLYTPPKCISKIR